VPCVTSSLLALEGEQDGSRTPSGPASGDLTGNYPNPDLAPGAVTGADIGDNSLTGVQIDESTLGLVPNAANATNATNATNVNGLQARAFHYAENAGRSLKTFLSLGGFLIGASCSAGPVIDIVAGSSVNNSYVRSSNTATDSDFDSGQTIDLDNPDADGARTVSYRAGAAAAASTTFDSQSVSASLSYDTDPVTGPDCQIAGTATGRP
jgi:hypothetical protein